MPNRHYEPGIWVKPVNLTGARSSYTKAVDVTVARDTVLKINKGNNTKHLLPPLDISLYPFLQGLPYSAAFCYLKLLCRKHPRSNLVYYSPYNDPDTLGRSELISSYSMLVTRGYKQLEPLQVVIRVKRGYYTFDPDYLNHLFHPEQSIHKAYELYDLARNYHRKGKTMPKEVLDNYYCPDYSGNNYRHNAWVVPTFIDNS